MLASGLQQLHDPDAEALHATYDDVSAPVPRVGKIHNVSQVTDHLGAMPVDRSASLLRT